MKKKCPLCNKLIEVTDKQNSSVVEFKCPKCDGSLLLFTEYTSRVEGMDYVRVKCPSCEKYFLHEISRNYSKRFQSFAHFHQNCPMCEAPVVISGIMCNDGQGSIFDADIDTFASFSSAYYVIAAKPPFNCTSRRKLSTVWEAKAELKKLLSLPDDSVLQKIKRHDDYKTVSEAVQSYIVSRPEDAEKFLPTDFSVIYSSDNLLTKKEKRGGFLRLLELLISITDSVKDVCGKAAITDSVIHDLDTIPSEVPYKWSKNLRDCQSSPGYNIFDPFYQTPVFMDFGNLVGFQAERHLYKPYNEPEIIKTFKEDTWYMDYGCVHPVKIIDYATKNTVRPNAIIEVLTNAGIPIFELEKETIDWHDYENQFSSLKLTEDALGFPAGRSIRQALGNESSVWRNTRKAVLKKQKYTCQICGYHTEEIKYLHAHEVWAEGPEPDVLCLTDIQLLCNRCHDCKHIGQFLMRNPTNSEPYDRMIMHMAKVNACSPKVIYAYHKYRMEQMQKRREKEMIVRSTQYHQGEHTPPVVTCQTIRYIINSNVINRAELLTALEKKGLVYHNK